VRKFVLDQASIPSLGKTLALRKTLRRVLDWVAAHFDPHLHDFVLVTKSHGGEEMALTTRISRRHEEIKAAELLASLDPDQAMAQPIARLGVTKSEYLEVLREAGEAGMQFRLVFLETCQGTFQHGIKQSLPKNVAVLFASGDRFLSYSTLNYEELIGQMQQDVFLADLLDAYLATRFLALFRQPPSISIWTLFWFLPLILYLGWYFITRKFPSVTEPVQLREN